MLNRIVDVIINKQWSIVVGLAVAGLAWALNENIDNFPVEAAPIVAAVITWLRVWSKDSVDQLIANEQPVEVGTIGDLDG